MMLLTVILIVNSNIMIEKLELSAIFANGMLKNGIFCEMVILVIFCKKLIC